MTEIPPDSSRSGSEEFGDAFNPERHDAAWLTGSKAEQRLEAVYERMQRGLIYPAPFMAFATFWRREDDPRAGRIDKRRIASFLDQLRGHIHENLGGANTTAVVGVSVGLWRQWCKSEGSTPPAGLQFKQEIEHDGHVTSAVIERASGAWVNSGGHLW